MTEIVSITLKRNGKLFTIRVGDTLIDEAGPERVVVDGFERGPDIRIGLPSHSYCHCWPFEGLTPLSPLEQLAKEAK